MNEESRYWDRIFEAAEMLANFHEVEVPAGVQTATGNVWEREKSRRQALNAFLPTVKKPDFSEQIPLWVMANQMDAYALETIYNGEGLEPDTDAEEVEEDDGS